MPADWSQTFTAVNGTDVNALTPDTGSGPWSSYGFNGSGFSTSGRFLVHNTGSGLVGLAAQSYGGRCTLAQATADQNQQVVVTLRVSDTTVTEIGAVLRFNTIEMTLRLNLATGVWRGNYNGVNFGATPDLVGLLTVPATYTITFRMVGSGGSNVLSAWIAGVKRCEIATGFGDGPPTVTGLFVSQALGTVNSGTQGVLFLSAYSEAVPTAATGYDILGPSRLAPGVPSLHIAQYELGVQPLQIFLTPTGAVATADTTFTFSDGGAGGTFSAATLVIPTGDAKGFFTYRPPTGATAGSTITLTATNDEGLDDSFEKVITITNDLLVVVSNSIASASIGGDARSWPYLLGTGTGTSATLAPAVANCSFSSATTVSLDGVMTDTYDALLTDNMGPDVRPVLLLHEGCNANDSGTYTAAQIAAQYRTFLANRRAVWPVNTRYVSVIWADWTDWDSTELTRSHAAAALIRSDVTPYVSILIDLQADPFVATAAYLADAVHPSVTGAQHLCGVLGGAARTLHAGWGLRPEDATIGEIAEAVWAYADRTLTG